tara:strand:- start:330 stop:614 length:285 start_codon:yes stop_codon:yes gene_type:complete
MNDELIFHILYCVWFIFCISGSTAILFRDFIIDFIDESEKSDITLKEFFLDTYFPKPIKLDQENFKPMFDEEDWERGYRCGGELIINNLEDSHE